MTLQASPKARNLPSYIVWSADAPPKRIEAVLRHLVMAGLIDVHKTTMAAMVKVTGAERSALRKVLKKWGCSATSMSDMLKVATKLLDVEKMK